MEVKETNLREVGSFLRNAELSGWNWVAFSSLPNDIPPVFEGFISAAEAQAFCYANDVSRSYPYEDDPYAVREKYLDYRFMPVETLRQSYQGNGRTIATAISQNTFREAMESQSVQLLPGQPIEQVLALVQDGRTFPVQWNNNIDPAKEIDRFHVFAHRHAGHQVYEIGHSLRMIGSFPSLDEAERCFKEQLKSDPEINEKSDYLLIGQYKGRQLIQDMEGRPEDYSGLTIKTAFYQFDADHRAKVWNELEINSLYEPKSIRHFLYARFDHENQILKLYDDRLQEVNPDNLKVSTYPDHFNYEILTIKNSIAMEINMKNYDYLKNQAMFLGFGEEPAKAIQEKMATGANDFTVPHQTKFGQDEVKSTLHFGKSNGGDLYFFKKFDLELKQPGADEPLKQTYFIGKENNYTLKERYNMLDSRAVYKELNKLVPVGEGENRKFKATDETYKAWRALDFKQTDDRGNFLPKMMFWDHEKAIKNYPIKELAEGYDRSRLLASLEKGNPTKVTIIKDGQEIKGTMAANPRQAGFDFYDSNNQRMEVKQVEVQKAVKQEQGINSDTNLGKTNDGAKVVPLQNNQTNDQPGQSAGKKADQKESENTAKNNRQSRRQRMHVS
ncbi:hypothetical protein [Mucilaginibacter paludis]|uniref:Uncharacterized protein n=1 Tax=Mucilaginibacter paludis DSM 18603 TaxID=714943 RepID=H1YHH5_9SPHI|nr:hypothetical protein [Mucilaginibacter paludis]EHQ25509.1 hypothetical protein Mucpa_1347 [Mucilaginibacter paludis DSM 18603]